MSATTQLYKEAASITASTQIRVRRNVAPAAEQRGILRSLDGTAPGTKSTDKTKGTHYGPTRSSFSVSVYFGLAILSGAVLLDMLQITPGGLMIMPVLDYVLPVMNDPDAGKDIERIVHDRGFEFERHQVITQDGYIIEMHRVFNPAFENVTRPALVYGVSLFCSSATSLIDFRNTTAPYQFADAGYDVWLMNARGNRYGMRHLSLDPEKDKLAFFNFTYLDISVFDCAAQIDYVIEHTGQPKIFAAGASQGAATLLALLSKRPEYNAKLRAVASYGGFRSVCWASHPLLLVITKIIWLFYDFMQHLEPLAAVMTQAEIGREFCSRTGSLCGHALVHTGFKSPHYLNVSRFGVYLEHVPAGTSLKNLVYYAQSNKFGCDGTVREFDYDAPLFTSMLIKLGLKESINMRAYGTREPPLLNPKNIKVPLKLYYSDGDDFAPQEEILKMIRDIGIPPSNVHRIADRRFSHLNFVYNQRRLTHVEHTIDFFQGMNSSWTDGIS